VTQNLIASQAKELRLAINTTECGQVFDHLAPHARISLDKTEEANNVGKTRFWG
jgi:hypothetical protein